MPADMPDPSSPARSVPGGVSADAPRVLDLYAAMAGSAAVTARRYHLGDWTALALIAVYFLLRTADANASLLGPWLAGAVVLAILSPVHGLVVLAAIAPFNEGFTVTRDIGSKSILAGALLASSAARFLADPVARRRPPAPVVLAIVLLVGTGLGLVRTRLRWGDDFFNLATQAWVTGIATMLVVFVVAVWVARNGDLRPLWVTLAATTVAGLLSLADYWGDASLRDGLLGWALVGQFIPSRLTGVIRSPTSTAALVMLPATFFLVAAALGRDRRLRVGAAALAVPLLLAAYLTYNRAVFIALWLVAVAVAWRVRRRLGLAVLAIGLVAGIALVPWYISLRGQAVGAGSQAAPGQVLIASDVQRLTAWTAATRMFLDEPILGQGYRAYRQLSVQFGDDILNAPHNEWLRLFAEHGVVIGIVGLAFALVTLRHLARRPDWLGTALLVSFISLCLAASFNNAFLFNQVTIPAAILAGTGVARAWTREPVRVADG